MRFSCGENFEHKKARLEQWHDHFCLFPVSVGVDKNGKDICVWFDTVERRGKFLYWPGDSFWIWEYRSKK